MRELNGSYAEYAIVDSADLYRKPSRLTHDEAAAADRPQLRLAGNIHQTPTK